MPVDPVRPPLGAGLPDRLEQGAPDVVAAGRRRHEEVLEVAGGLPGPGRGVHDAVGHPDAAAGVVEGDQAEQGVVAAGAEPLEGGPGGLVGQLGAVEGQIAAPQRPPVVPVVGFEWPYGAHPSSFPSAGSGGRDRSAGPQRRLPEGVPGRLRIPKGSLDILRHVARVTEGYASRGREVPIVWNGKKLKAWAPAPLAGQDFSLGPRAIRLTERAGAAVVAAGNHAARVGPLATLLLRSEGVASSSLEGLRTPLVDVAAAEVGGSQVGEALGDVATHVADNLGAVVGALGSPGRPLTRADLHDWHRRLMEARGGLPEGTVGAYRTEQTWVGGTSPRDAGYVPPPPALIEQLMDDLIAFANDDTLDAVTQAAVVHAQFESIHPYGDGNGRIGRVLIGWVLARRLDISVPPPVSVVIARDPGGYLAGLTLFRLGQTDAWVEWMAGALEHSSEAADAVMARTEVLVADWRERLDQVRADAAARRVVDLLVEHPVLSAAVVAERLGISARSGQNALATLADHGIVEPYRPGRVGPGRPTRYWAAGELIALVAAPPGG